MGWAVWCGVIAAWSHSLNAVYFYQYAVREETFSEEHPGVDIFDCRAFSRIYHLPERCRLKEDFHYSPGSSLTDQLIAKTPTGLHLCLLELVTWMKET